MKTFSLTTLTINYSTLFNQTAVLKIKISKWFQFNKPLMCLLQIFQPKPELPLKRQVISHCSEPSMASSSLTVKAAILTMATGPRGLPHSSTLPNLSPLLLNTPTLAYLHHLVSVPDILCPNTPTAITPLLNCHLLYEALFKVSTPTIPNTPDSPLSSMLLSSLMAIVTSKKLPNLLIYIHYLLLFLPLQNGSPVRAEIVVLSIDLS